MTTNRQNHFSNLVVNKSEIDFTRLIPIQGDINDYTMARILVQSSESSRRILEKCEVRFYIQKYLCSKEDQSFRIINRDYKNPVKKQIDKMEMQEIQIRKCLLNLFDNQIAWFLVKKDIDPKQFDLAMKSLKEEDANKFEDYLYYKFIIESIVFSMPTEPNSLVLYDKYISKFQEEIRYFIQKGFFKEGISWANAIYQKVFQMNNALKKQLTPSLKKKLIPEMKSIILNLTYCLLWKPNELNKNKDLEEIVDIIINRYYTNFAEKDDKWFKISVRLAHCYLSLKDFDKCEAKLKELALINGSDETVKNMTESLRILKTNKDKKPKKTIIEYFRNLPSVEEAFDENAFTWGDSSKELDLSSNLELSAINMINILN